MRAGSESRLTAALTRMPARQLHLLLGGALVVVLALLWSFALRAPLAQLRAQRAEQARMALSAADPAQLARQLAALTGEVAALESSLSRQGGGGADLPVAGTSQLQLRLIGAVERAAARHAVQLRGAVPGPARTIAGFREVSIDVEAVGSYQALMAWMADADGGALAVVSFDLGAGDSAGARVMKVRMAAYVLPKENT